MGDVYVFLLLFFLSQSGHDIDDDQRCNALSSPRVEGDDRGVFELNLVHDISEILRQSGMILSCCTVALMMLFSK